MSKLVRCAIAPPVLALLASLSTGCGLILDLTLEAPLEDHVWRCSAQLYRNLPDPAVEFTEQWQAYVWQLDEPTTLCTEKIGEYLAKRAAPGFDWYYRDLTIEPVTKHAAVDYAVPWPARSFGAPLGAEVRWLDPPETEAAAFVEVVDKEGVVRIAEPRVGRVAIDFAERTGLRDRATGDYDPALRHLSFSDLDLELATPFLLGDDLTVTSFYVQSVGTATAELRADGSYWIYPGASKFIVHAAGWKGGESGVSSFSVTNEVEQAIRVTQGPSGPEFLMEVHLDAESLGQPILVRLVLQKPRGTPFQAHQPVVTLEDKTVYDVPVDLVADDVFDRDGDLHHYLWFEDFEAGTERYLGAGNPLRGVPFRRGTHRVTLVAYDARGASNSATMTLSVGTNAPPVANDDHYAVDEDHTLAVAGPGALANDTDANGDPLTAVLEGGPSHGSLTLGPSGAFSYVPAPDYHGPDSFTYRANDGELDSAVATVHLTVTPVNDPPVAAGDAYSVNEDSVLTVAAPGVLVNDTDADGDALSAVQATGPLHGTLTLGADGSLVYTPAPNFTGTDGCTYWALDGLARSAEVTVTLTVVEVPEDQEVQDLADAVGELGDAGVLNDGQVNSLVSKLERAIAKIRAGQLRVACNQLQAFVNEVLAYVRGGMLTAAQGQALIDRARNIMEELGC